VQNVTADALKGARTIQVANASAYVVGDVITIDHLDGVAVANGADVSSMEGGESIFAFALTEPNAGSDIRSIETRAERRGDGYLINGAKSFITNGGICTYALVAARTVDRDAESAALKDDSMEVRRVAVSVLAGTGGGLDDGSRLARIMNALDDPSGLVRYEALRAYAARGAAAASSFTLLVPIVSGVLSVFTFGETFDLPKLLGAGLVLIGLLLLQRRPAQASYRDDSAGESQRLLRQRTG